MPWADDGKPVTEIRVWAPCDHDDTVNQAKALIAGRHLEDIVSTLWGSDLWDSNSVSFTLDQWVAVRVEGWFHNGAKDDNRFTIRVEGDYPLLVACEALRQLEVLTTKEDHDAD